MMASSRFPFAPFALLLALAGCSSGTQGSSTAATPNIPSGMAQLIVQRDSGLLIGVSAVLEVNGQRSEFTRDEARSSFIRPGKTTVSVSGSSPPGRYTISFNAEPSKSYMIEVSKRPEGYAPPPNPSAIRYELIENDGAFKLALAGLN